MNWAQSTSEKSGPLRNQVIVIDGLWGTGKSLLAPIVGTMSDVEKYRANDIYEALCVVEALGRMDPDACVALLQAHGLHNLEDSLKGRGINFRWADDSGTHNNRCTARYVARTASLKALPTAVADRAALFLMSHNLMLTPEMILRAFGESLRLLHVVRHPVHVFNHWQNFLGRFDGTRVCTLALDAGGVKVPWFWAGQAEQYANLTLQERVVRSMVIVYRWLFQNIDDLAHRSDTVMVVSFEDIVTKTEPILGKLSKFLGRSHSPTLAQTLAEQQIPRERLDKGKLKPQYGLVEHTSDSEALAYQSLLAKILDGLSDETATALKDLIHNYNTRYPSILASYSI